MISIHLFTKLPQNGLIHPEMFKGELPQCKKFWCRPSCLMGRNRESNWKIKGIEWCDMRQASPAGFEAEMLIWHA